MFVQNDLVDKNNWLVELLQKEPFVRSSVSRLVSHLVTSEIQICESTHQTSVSFKKINEKLHYILQKKLRQVLPIAVEQAFYCGFCVFVMQKSDNPALKKFPYLLPVGSYTWTVEHVSENTKNVGPSCLLWRLVLLALPLLLTERTLSWLNALVDLPKRTCCGSFPPLLKTY